MDGSPRFSTRPDIPARRPQDHDGDQTNSSSRAETAANDGQDVGYAVLACPLLDGHDRQSRIVLGRPQRARGADGGAGRAANGSPLGRVERPLFRRPIARLGPRSSG